MRSSKSRRRRGRYLASAIDNLPGPHSDADLVAVPDLETDTRRAAGLGILERHLRDVERRFPALEPALRARLGRLAVAGGDVDAGNHDLAFLGQALGDFAMLALVLAGQDHDAITLLDLARRHYSTSGARLMIFMCFLARSSRTTGPKMRVPIGSSFLFTSTAALPSNRIVEPSAR